MLKPTESKLTTDNIRKRFIAVVNEYNSNFATLPEEVKVNFQPIYNAWKEKKHPNLILELTINEHNAINDILEGNKAWDDYYTIILEILTFLLWKKCLFYMKETFLFIFRFFYVFYTNLNDIREDIREDNPISVK